MKPSLSRTGLVSAAALCAVAAAVFVVVITLRQRPPQPNAVDLGFTRDMIVHHQQALDMSDAVRGRVGPEVAAVAATIGATQGREIGRLQGWLEAWSVPLVGSDPVMAWSAEHTGDAAHSHDSNGMGIAMGMASVDEMNELRTLNGNQLDVRYLQLMIRHHRGAVAMSEEAARRANTPLVRGAAATIAAGQAKEIARMGAMLHAFGGVELPG